MSYCDCSTTEGESELSTDQGTKQLPIIYPLYTYIPIIYPTAMHNSMQYLVMTFSIRASPISSDLV